MESSWIRSTNNLEK